MPLEGPQVTGEATLDALHLNKDTVFISLDTALDDSQKVNLAMQCLLKVI